MTDAGEDESAGDALRPPPPLGDQARVSRSSGPGGQHANTTESRVEAVFDVESSSALSDVQKRRVIAHRAL